MIRQAAYFHAALSLSIVIVGCARQQQGTGEGTEHTGHEQANETMPDQNTGGFVTYNKGLDALKSQDYDLAIIHFNEAIRLSPGNVLPYRSRAFAYGENGDYDNAIADCTTALELTPNHAGTYTFRGLYYLETGDFDRTIADSTEAIRLGGANAFTLINRGVAYDEKGEYEKAIADFSEAIRLDPAMVKAYIDRASAYFNNKQYEKSVADCTEAIRLEPNDPRIGYAFAYRARAYRALGDVANATKDEQRARELNK